MKKLLMIRRGIAAAGIRIQDHTFCSKNNENIRHRYGHYILDQRVNPLEIEGREIWDTEGRGRIIM